MKDGIDLSELPKCKGGMNEGKVEWAKSIGYKVRFVYNDVKGWIEIVDYNKKKRKLTIKWEDKYNSISITNFIRCGIGKLLGKVTSDFKIEIGTRIKDDKRDITITDRKYIKDKYGANRKHYKYICNVCGYSCGEHYKNGEFEEEYFIIEASLLRGTGCACCCPNPKVVVPKINSIVANKETHWMMQYFQGGYDEAKKYMHQSNLKIKSVCFDCGRVKKNPIAICDIYNNHSIGCPCGDDGFSYPSKIMYSFLKQLNIDFETEYSPEWAKPKRYDFYFKLSNQEYIIEMDGGWHKIDNKMTGQTKEESKAIDDYKDKLAEEHGIKVIRIDCDYRNYDAFKYIKDNILLKSELNEIFDLSKIDWNKCEEFTMTNIKKMICEYWRDKEEWETVSDLSKKFNICKTAIRNYIRQGSKIWDWCNYNGKEELIKSNKRKGYLYCKRVEIFDKNKNSLGIFNSVKSLSEQSLIVFGVSLSHTAISSVARGDRPHHKGYTFKYVNEADNQQSQTTDVTNKEQSA